MSKPESSLPTRTRAGLLASVVAMAVALGILGCGAVDVSPGARSMLSLAAMHLAVLCLAILIGELVHPSIKRLFERGSARLAMLSR